jgi:hypothetical protein
LKYSIYLFLLALIVGISCSSNKLKSTTLGLKAPPNGIKFRENLFIDKTEVSNINWRGYTSWVRQITPNSFSATLPDTTVWHFKNNDNGVLNSTNIDSTFYISSKNTEMYFRNPIFNEYPVVGLSWEQVKKYCDWRSDRVYEFSLIKLGKIPANPNQDSTNFFTIERYLSGQFMGIKPDSTVLVPRFRLPSEFEWEQACLSNQDEKEYPYGINFKSKRHQKWIKKYGLFNAINVAETKPNDLESKGIYIKMPNIDVSGLKNILGIYGMIGNISEMIEVKGIAKGGSFVTPFANCKASDQQIYTKPTRWLGFRCVSHWENLKIK